MNEEYNQLKTFKAVRDEIDVWLMNDFIAIANMERLEADEQSDEKRNTANDSVVQLLGTIMYNVPYESNQKQVDKILKLLNSDSLARSLMYRLCYIVTSFTQHIKDYPMLDYGMTISGLLSNNNQKWISSATVYNNYNKNNARAIVHGSIPWTIWYLSMFHYGTLVKVVDKLAS